MPLLLEVLLGLGTTSYSSPFDTLITGPVPADKLQSDLLRTNHLQTLHFSYKGNAALCLYLSTFTPVCMYGLRPCTSELLMKVNCRIEFRLMLFFQLLAEPAQILILWCTFGLWFTFSCTSLVVHDPALFDLCCVGIYYLLVQVELRFNFDKCVNVFLCNSMRKFRLEIEENIKKEARVWKSWIGKTMY